MSQVLTFRRPTPWHASVANERCADAIDSAVADLICAPGDLRAADSAAEAAEIRRQARETALAVLAALAAAELAACGAGRV